jgi:hypothetical protein
MFGSILDLYELRSVLNPDLSCASLNLASLGNSFSSDDTGGGHRFASASDSMLSSK